MIVNKNENFQIPFQLKTSSGGLVDITSSTITCYIKESPEAASIVITKVSTDTAQIQKLIAASGIGVVKILAANTASLDNRTYYYEIFTTDHKVTGFIKFRQNTGIVTNDIPLHGTTAERTALGLLLTTNDRIWFYDDDDQTPYFWSGAAWT